MKTNLPTNKYLKLSISDLQIEINKIEEMLTNLKYVNANNNFEFHDIEENIESLKLEQSEIQKTLNKKRDSFNKQKASFINKDPTIVAIKEKLPELNIKWREAINGRKEFLLTWDKYVSTAKAEFSETNEYLNNYKALLSAQFEQSYIDPLTLPENDSFEEVSDK